MFGKVAAFEFRYQARQPVFWVGVIIFFLLSFATVASSNVQHRLVGQRAQERRDGDRRASTCSSP
jgi:hypothetical protein